MSLYTFLHDLCTVELADLMYGDENSTETPSDEMRHKLTPILNSCLRQIYIDHQVEQKELVLRTDANITQYFLRATYALTNPSPDEKYILDSALAPFLGDVARVDEVLDENGVRVFSAVDNSMGGQVRRPTWDSLVFQYPLDGKEYLVRYRAAAPVFSEASTSEVAATPFFLPPGFTDLLRLRMAERVYGAQKTPESIAKSQQYKMEGMELAALLVGQGTAGDEGWNLDALPARRGFR